MPSLLLLEKLFLWGVFYSFCGWIYETILVSLQEHRFVNRGFLNGPLCPIYGAGSVLAILLLTPLHNPVMMFVIGAIGACALEYVTSWVMEKIFHARWWDYSNFRFNLNGRVCLLGAVIFGIGSLLIVEVVQPVVGRMTDRLSLHWLHVMLILLLALIIADLLITVIGFNGFYERLTEFAAEMKRSAGESASQIIDDYANAATSKFSEMRAGATDTLVKVREISEVSLSRASQIQDKLLGVLGNQQKRMVRSFPHLKSNGYGDLIKELRNIIIRDEEKRHHRHG